MNIALKNAREKQHLTQSDVAYKTGIAVRAYQNYELGEREPKVSVAIKIATVLNTNISEIFGEKEGKRNERL